MDQVKEMRLGEYSRLLVADYARVQPFFPVD